MNELYDRYKKFRTSIDVNNIPFISIAKDDVNDEYIVYNRVKHRLDRLSTYYYGLPNYDFLIFAANPDYTLEADIPNNTILRIPLPFDRALKEFNDGVKKYIDFE